MCPFTVVVFPGDLKRVGDIRGLQGRQIEIEGEVKGYDGRAEIILRRVSQLRGNAGRIPLCPRNTLWSGMVSTAPGSSAIRRLRRGHLTRSSLLPETRKIPASLGRRRTDGTLRVPTHGDARRSQADRHTAPLRSSSSGYFVPRQVTPSFQSVSPIDRNSV